MKQALFAVIFTSLAFAQTAPKSSPKLSTAPKAAAPAPNLLNPASLNRTAPAIYRVKLATTKGDIIIEVTRSWAPRGADRFYNLVRAGFYTDAPFYRVMPGFMAQFGISARPDVNRAWTNANIPDDPRNMESNKRGKVTFATTSAPNSRSNTLFINIGDNGYLDGQGFVPIGEVSQGMEHVDALYNGYGDTSPQQASFEAGGKAFVDRAYPKLDRILTATIEPAAAAPAPSGAPKSAVK